MSCRSNNGEISPYLITELPNLIGGLVTFNLPSIHDDIFNYNQNYVPITVNSLTVGSTLDRGGENNRDMLEEL